MTSPPLNFNALPTPPSERFRRDESGVLMFRLSSVAGGLWAKTDAVCGDDLDNMISAAIVAFEVEARRKWDEAAEAEDQKLYHTPVASEERERLSKQFDSLLAEANRLQDAAEPWWSARERVNAR